MPLKYWENSKTAEKKRWLSVCPFISRKKVHRFLVHRLVAIVFLGSPPSALHQVAHGDGDKTNNHYYNLRWATRSENEKDKRCHGTDNRGSKHPLSKLTEVEAKEIIKSDLPRKDLSLKYKVSGSTITGIRQRKHWGHVSI